MYFVSDVSTSGSGTRKYTTWIYRMSMQKRYDGPSPHVQSVVDADVCEALTVLLSHRSWRVVKPALRTIGNIVCAEDEVA